MNSYNYLQDGCKAFIPRRLCQYNSHLLQGDWTMTGQICIRNHDHRRERYGHDDSLTNDNHPVHISLFLFHPFVYWLAHENLVSETFHCRCVK